MENTIYFVRHYAWDASCPNENDTVTDYCKGNAKFTAAFRNKADAEKFIDDLLNDANPDAEVIKEGDIKFVTVDKDYYYAYEIVECSIN